MPQQATRRDPPVPDRSERSSPGAAHHSASAWPTTPKLMATIKAVIASLPDAPAWNFPHLMKIASRGKGCWFMAYLAAGVANTITEGEVRIRSADVMQLGRNSLHRWRQLPSRGAG